MSSTFFHLTVSVKVRPPTRSLASRTTTLTPYSLWRTRAANKPRNTSNVTTTTHILKYFLKRCIKTYHLVQLRLLQLPQSWLPYHSPFQPATRFTNRFRGPLRKIIYSFVGVPLYRCTDVQISSYILWRNVIQWLIISCDLSSDTRVPFSGRSGDRTRESGGNWAEQVF